MTTKTHPVAEGFGGPQGAAAVSVPTTGKLIDVDCVEAKTGFDKRTIYRYADAGFMPWGVKVGSLRRWSECEIDDWIAAGCPKVRTAKGGAR